MQPTAQRYILMSSLKFVKKSKNKKMNRKTHNSNNSNHICNTHNLQLIFVINLSKTHDFDIANAKRA